MTPGWVGVPNGERFWVVIGRFRVDTPNLAFSGYVKNDLIYTAHHGLVLYSPIDFEWQHVLTYEEPEHFEHLRQMNR